VSNATADGELFVVSEGCTDNSEVVMRFEQATRQIVDFQDELGTVSSLSQYIGRPN
jgi:hypothetical protein